MFSIRPALGLLCDLGKTIELLESKGCVFGSHGGEREVSSYLELLE